MGTEAIRALTFDTGGTILDWHSGFRTALEAIGTRRGLRHDWSDFACELRRRSLHRMIRLGEHEPPTYNVDHAHRAALDQLLNERGLNSLTEDDRHAIAWDTPHKLSCWSDFPAVLPRLRARYICVPFTILSFRMIIDTARINGLSWDGIISCEAIGKYKDLPETYRTAARLLQLRPSECCMIACHNFDLDAARAEGFRTAFVRRPDEWGGERLPDTEPSPHHDFIVDSFPDLAKALGA